MLVDTDILGRLYGSLWTGLWPLKYCMVRGGGDDSYMYIEKQI
jgi:hypothetical protein